MPRGSERGRRSRAPAGRASTRARRAVVGLPTTPPPPCSAPRAPARRRRSSSSSPTACSTAAGRPTRCSCSPRRAPSATRLRDVLALRLGVPTDGPLARTVSSLAFEVVGARGAGGGRAGPRGCSPAASRTPTSAALLDGPHRDRRRPGLAGAPRRRRAPAARLPHRAARAHGARDRVRRRPRSGCGSSAASTDRPEWVAAADFIDEYLARAGAPPRPTSSTPPSSPRFAVAAIADGRRRATASRGCASCVVDDLQEATESTVAILRALAGRGVAVIALRRPGCRRERLPRRRAGCAGPPRASGSASTCAELRARRRAPARIRRCARSPTPSPTRIGTAAAGRSARRPRRAPPSSDPRPSAARDRARDAPRRASAATIARVLREEHLLHGVPWSELAVVVRSGAHDPGDRPRARARRGADPHVDRRRSPLRDDARGRGPARARRGRDRSRSSSTPAIAAELLLGPFGGLDPLGLRRLRLALRAEELAGGGSRQSDELLVEALRTPAAARDDRHAGRAARRAAGRRPSPSCAKRAATSTAEELLWLAWERSGVARAGASRRSAAGIAAAEANRNLDGVVALFSAAKRFAERRPDAGVDELPRRTCSTPRCRKTRSPRAAATTPCSSRRRPALVGLEFDTVVVAGLQDGVWPNLRLRGSLLGAAAARAASSPGRESPPSTSASSCSTTSCGCSRSRSRARATRVVLAAVVNDDETAQRVLLPAAAGHARCSTRHRVVPLSLRGRDRPAAAHPHRAGPHRSRSAARPRPRSPAWREAGVAGARSRPTGTGSSSRRRPGRSSTASEVPVSPSRLESFEESPLDWFLDTDRRLRRRASAMNVGTILHWAMETATDPTVDAIWAAVESRWGELRLRGAVARRAAAARHPRARRRARRVPRATSRATASSSSRRRDGSASRSTVDRAVRS